MLYRFTSKCKFQRFLVECREAIGDGVSLAIVNENIFAGVSDAGLQWVINIRLKRVSNDTSRDIISNDLIKRLVVPLVRITDIVHEFSTGNHTFVRKKIVFSIGTFQYGRFLSSENGDCILHVLGVEQEDSIQSRSDHHGAILPLAVYKIPHGIVLFPVRVMG